LRCRCDTLSVSRRVVFVLALMVVPVAACGSAQEGPGEASVSASTETTAQPSRPDSLRDTALSLWGDRKQALVGADRSSIAAVEIDPARTRDISYLLDYCTNYCEASEVDGPRQPSARVLGSSADGHSFVAVIEDDLGLERPVLRQSVVRFEEGPEGWRPSLVAAGQIGDELKDFDGDSEIRALDERGTMLIEQYLSFEAAIDGTGEAPTSIFAPGPYTTGLVKVYDSFAPDDPRVIDTTTGGLEAADPSFEIVAGDTRLYCGYVAWTNTMSAADGSLLSPDVLGDYSHLVEPGSYRALVVHSSEEPCLVEAPGSKVSVLTWDWNRTTVEAVR
jgi:hypothetical protein